MTYLEELDFLAGVSSPYENSMSMRILNSALNISEGVHRAVPAVVVER